jgi:CDP-glucose 4,6-dehydratase
MNEMPPNSEGSQWQPSQSFWEGRPVAVTGATGFVGAHLTAELVSLGARVVVLRRDEVPANPVSDAWAGRVSVVRGQLEDQEPVERLLTEYDVATVFHLAAQSQVGVANINPGATFSTNVRGTWSLLEAVRRTGSVSQVVVASSDKAYGTQSQLPYVEDSPLNAVHPYDVSKACADLISICYGTCYDVTVAVTRCGNFFGPGDINWSRLVPGTIRSVLRGESPVLRSDGTMVRDYLYVKDGARAYLQLAEALERDSSLSAQAFNFSLEQPLSVLEMLDRIQKAAGTSLELDIRDSAKHEIQAQYLSAEKARSVLGWEPVFSLDHGLQETVDWYRTFLGGPGTL